MGRVLTKSAWNLARSCGNFLSAKLLRRSRNHCPVCGYWLSGFAPFGAVPRENAKCDHCGALERHRLAWLYFQRKTDLFDGREKRVLHMAPEPCFERRFRQRL